MTLAQALRLTKGSIVTSPYDVVPYAPRRVSEVWVNPGRTLVRIRVASVSKDWISPSRWMLPPMGATWDPRRAQWVTASGAPVALTLEREPEDE